MSIWVISQLLRSPSGAGPTPGLIIEDTYEGDMLSGRWSKPTGPTITVDSSGLRLQGADGSTKDASKKFLNIGYWVSTLRHYKPLARFKINAINSNCKGFYVGADSVNNGTVTSFCFSAWALLDLASSKLQVICSGSENAFKSPVQAEIGLSGIDINTSHLYDLSFDMADQIATARLKNINTLEEISVPYSYISNTPTNPNRNNAFLYGKGITGNTDVTIKYFQVSTDQQYRPFITLVSDSTWSGYCASIFANGVGALLQAETSGIVQINAGGGNTIDHVNLNKDEIVRLNPENIFIQIGTNPSDIGTCKKVIQHFINSLPGSNIYVFGAITRGDPNTVGTFNNQLKVAFPSHFKDNYNGTDGLADIVANGWMVDGLHRNDLGQAAEVRKIKVLLPALFP